MSRCGNHAGRHVHDNYGVANKVVGFHGAHDSSRNQNRFQLISEVGCRSASPLMPHNTWMTSDGQISHVSDTALMIAACRAHETELEDAFVKDPFAKRLAGERGFAIVEAMPHSEVMKLGMAIRTRFVDDLLLDALKLFPIRTVLSVGCGLDTRP